MRKLVFLLIVAVVMTVLSSCETVCSDTGAWCYTYDEWISMVNSISNNAPVWTPEPEQEPEPTASPTEVAPQSPLRTPVQMTFKMEQSCTWMGCVYEFFWGEK